MRYTREDGCRAWLTCGMLNPTAAADLLKALGSAEAVYDRFVRGGGGFLKQWRISESSIALLSEAAAAERMHEMMLRMRRLNIGIMGMGDDLYPDALRHIQQPPVTLFYRGAPECLMGKCITVVGSRSISTHAENATRRICRELSDAGVTIVSGLAMGADTAAHEGCLQGASPTAAVLACGMDIDYPLENAELKERIVTRGGVLLSEYPLGMHGSRHVFQMRNRIMSGLSKAVLMMEARIRSGSMITVEHALNQGREVFAYPGIPGSEASEGAHQLLREGASYFAYAQDVLANLGWDGGEAPVTLQQKQALPDMSPEQRKIYTLLAQGEMSFDELVAESGIPAPQLSVALTLLQMAGVIRPLPGKSYSRN